MTNVIETERLILKPVALSDLQNFIVSQQDAGFKTYTGGVQSTEAATEKFMKQFNFFRENGFGFFSVFLLQGGEWLGQVGITSRTTANFIELGWGFLPQFQGKGYAIEASSAMLQWCINHLGWREFNFCISPPNIQSVKLAEKLGAINIGKENVPEELKETDVEIWYLKYDDN